MRVDRCICQNYTLADLAVIARGAASGLTDIRAQTGCTTRCGMCLPYVLLMLETGKTSFPLLSEAAARQVVARHQSEHRADPPPAP